MCRCPLCASCLTLWAGRASASRSELPPSASPQPSTSAAHNRQTHLPRSSRTISVYPYVPRVWSQRCFQYSASVSVNSCQLGDSGAATLMGSLLHFVHRTGWVLTRLGTTLQSQMETAVPTAPVYQSLYCSDVAVGRDCVSTKGPRWFCFIHSAYWPNVCSIMTSAGDVYRSFVLISLTRHPQHHSALIQLNSSPPRAQDCFCLWPL